MIPSPSWIDRSYVDCFLHHLNSQQPTIRFTMETRSPFSTFPLQPLRRCIQPQGIRAVFKSDTTLRSHLIRPKDTVNLIRKDNVVYCIARKCSKIYIGEMKRPMQQRMEEHERDIRLARTQTFAVSKHANKTGHHPHWSEVKFID